MNLSAIAQGMGVAGEKVEDPEALGPALRKAFDSGTLPTVIDVSIDGALALNPVLRQCEHAEFDATPTLTLGPRTGGEDKSLPP